MQSGTPVYLKPESKVSDTTFSQIESKGMSKSLLSLLEGINRESPDGDFQHIGLGPTKGRKTNSKDSISRNPLYNKSIKYTCTNLESTLN